MNIEEARKRAGMSRKELSDWLEIPYRTISAWEKGERVCQDYVEKLIVEKILKGKGENTMDELRKCYKELNKRMEEFENKHKTDIMDFINLDDDIKSECMGDWTESDVKAWEYLAERMSTVKKAYDIIREELHLGEFLPEINTER